MKIGDYDFKTIRKWLKTIGVDWYHGDAGMMVHKAKNGQFILYSGDEKWAQQATAQIRRAGCYADITVTGDDFKWCYVHGDMFKVWHLDVPEQQQLL